MRTWLSWSSGKESAWALRLLRRDPRVELRGLFTLINSKHERVSLHATRLEMLERQAAAAGLPLRRIALPDPVAEEECDAILGRFIRTAAAEGLQAVAFGDLFLEEIRRYREDRLRGTGVLPLFPLWGRPTRELAEEMLAAGLEAYLSCVDLRKLPADLAGRRWSRELIAELPRDCDPCGENGEFHTIVAAGPMFSRSIPVAVGPILERDGYAWADILPLREVG